MKFRNPLTLIFSVVCLLSCAGEEAQSQTRFQKDAADTYAGVVVEQRWELPVALTEISGIAFFKNLLACIQDEDGTIFLFNPATGAVEREIAFGGPGDYEGIAIVGENAWVLRSDGQLFEVPDFASGKPVQARFYPTPLTQKQNTEGLYADVKNSRLLIAVKGRDPERADTKSVYAYDLNTHVLNPQPLYQLAAETESTSKKKAAKLQPAEIALHPTNEMIYVLDGPASVLYVMAGDGKVRKQYKLDKKVFPQPEGMAFSESGGRLFIATEGGKGRGAIMRLALPLP